MRTEVSREARDWIQAPIHRELINTIRTNRADLNMHSLVVRSYLDDAHSTSANHFITSTKESAASFASRWSCRTCTKVRVRGQRAELTAPKNRHHQEVKMVQHAGKTED